MCSQKEVIPREGIWRQHLPKDKTEALGTLRGKSKPRTAAEVNSKGRDVDMKSAACQSVGRGLGDSRD